MGRHRRSMRVPRRKRLQFDSLEQRRLLAIDIVGTAGDDSIAIIGTDTGFYASINGQVTNYTTSGLTDVNVDGLDGNDSVQVHKIRGAVTLGAFTGLVSGSAFHIALSNCETQYVFADAGLAVPFAPNSAVMQGTAGNDTAYHFDTHSILVGKANGQPSFNEVVGFSSVRFEGNDGDDVAISSPNEVSFFPVSMEFDATTHTATLFEQVAKFTPYVSRNDFAQFERMYAYGNPLWVGEYHCSFRGTSGNDTFYGMPGCSILTGDGYFYESIGYQSNAAFAGEGSDTALLYTDSGNSVFDASPTSSKMTYMGHPRLNFAEAFDFDRVYAFANPAVYMTANLNDGASSSTGNDVFYGASEYSLLYRPDSYLIQVLGFSAVNVTSYAGYDIAIILDRPGGNKLTATGDAVSMSYLGRSSVMIQAFDMVYANGLYGGVNRRVNAIQPRFPIVYAGKWFD